MDTQPHPEKLETKGAGMLNVTQNQLLESLSRLGGGWFANTGPEQTGSVSCSFQRLCCLLFMFHYKAGSPLPVAQLR